MKIKNTEEELIKNYSQVGKHLYVNSKVKLDLGSVEVKKDYQIVFLMGGGGTRLLHITNDKISKHMIKVNEQPLSKYMFNLWRNNGFKNFSFLIDNTRRGNSIKEFYKSGEEFNTKIQYSIENTKLGSGGAIKLAIDNGVIKNSFIAHFPDDIIINYENFPSDFVKICEAIKNQYDIVVLCVPGTNYAYGEVIERDGEVVDFVEKPFVRKNSNVGIFWVSERVFPLIQELNAEKEVKIERTVFKKIAQEKKMLMVLLPTEYWIPVNDDPALKKFEAIIKSG